MMAQISQRLESASWLAPWVRLLKGEDPREQISAIVRGVGVPLLAFLLFLGVWDAAASRIQTSLGAVPGPAQVWEQAQGLWLEHQQERQKAEAFYQRQEERNASKLAQDPAAQVKWRTYNGRPTYLDQIVTSLYTVFVGFSLAVLIAVPVGVVCGLSKTMYAAVNPLIQIFKPVSPLAWLPLVTMVVSAVYVTDDPLFEKSFVNSAITVTLCCMWPTLVNTVVGVSGLDKDLNNVSLVLRLSWTTKVRKVVLPFAVPMIFTGMRLSLGVGWMVLIAAEMLAQNPGLGKFVWDEFQNGSSNSLGRIMVAVFTIGFIGFALDRVMLAIQRRIAWDKTADIR
ncbi:ABC-type nitrate/sulfonate/bicarbonate transport system, permease component [Hahella chejuensis KCTC 2396]|uniref:ABC-type nitrate/sulfonate/bicarbonate transport system, permease component n=1 Tax=Hahella chejuensis (strain KCTC 2396) TaxID=349521 RepID=Q2S7N9_HAHCH|nr:ABC transporter permease [Hahella chejuensis]ABC33335.1 ABC-type nitrate/sulfonate/bicarbonate transport system, permease component [Hahella chejuensis KCTC 2396]